MLGYSGGHGISLASFHIWVVATTQRIRLGQYIDHLLKSIEYISVNVSEIIYEGT